MSAESELLCPHCDYNLTGLPENRCPECGERFDPAEVRRIAEGEAMPATPWDTPGATSPFFQTWLMSLFSAGRLAERFPAHHDTAYAWGYSLACYATAAGFFIVLGLIAIAEAVGVFFAVMFGATFAFCACEALVAGALALLLWPRRGRRRYHFWRGLTHYTSGFTVMTGLWGGLALLIMAPFAPNTGPEQVALWTLAAVIFLWWTGALWLMIFTAARPTALRWIACLLIPLIGAGSIYLGVLFYATVVFLTIA